MAAREQPRWTAVMRLAARRFLAQDMAHHASALTYPAVLALFQAMLLGVALLGLLGSSRTIARLAAFLDGAGADPRVVEGVITAARGAVEARGASAVTLVLAIAFALFVCSSAFVAAGTALNVVLEVRDDRSFLQRQLRGVRHSVVAIVLAVAASVAVFLGGDLAPEIFDEVGLGEVAKSVWPVIRYPVAAVLAITAYAWMYYSAPSVSDPHWRWISLGAVVGVAIWMVASFALFLFASRSGSYNATYGAFATGILLLVWLWLTNLTLLFGAEINAAGRYAEDAQAPMTRTGDPPEIAQHEAAKRHGA